MCQLKSYKSDSSRAGVNIIIAAPIDDANSGGPVLADGKVVGIVTRGGSGLGTATLALIVKTYLEGNGVDWGSSATVRPPALTPQPTVTLTVEPDRITKGTSATLRWSSTDAHTATLAARGESTQIHKVLCKRNSLV